MQLVSVNVGLPRMMTWGAKRFESAIYKAPVVGPQLVQTRNITGDQQANRSVHGGLSKAVYVYPAEHYAFMPVIVRIIKRCSAPLLRRACLKYGVTFVRMCSPNAPEIAILQEM